MTDPADTFFAELEAEIASATAKSKLKVDAAALKKQALNMRLDAHIRRRAADDLRAIQAIIEADTWIPVRTGALFAEQLCDGCGSINYNFLQYMQEERHIRNTTSRRWVRTPLPDANLPRETIVQPLATHMCADCCQDHDFNVAAPSIRLLPHNGSLTVSSTYTQGDINGSSTKD